MGSNRFESKRALSLIPVPANAAEGSIGFVVKGWDIAKFGNSALFENWEGIPTGTPLTSGTGGNTLQFHDSGGNWKGAVRGDSGSAMVVLNVARLSAGTATANNASLGCYKPFYINRHTTWNGAPSGIVFEALANLTDAHGNVFNCFLGMVSKDNPGATGTAAPAYTDKTTNIKRWGFCHYGTTTAILHNTALGSGSYTYFGTSTVTDTSATVHLKAVLVMNPYVVEGTTFNNCVKFYVDDVLAGIVDGSAASFPASGEVPYYPYFYNEAVGAVGVDGREMKLKGVKVYYF